MAPSTMFSYLRSGHAKRNASPIPSPSPAACPPPSPAHPTAYLSSPRFPDTASHASASPISPFPPQLPPIARVASSLHRGSSSDTDPHSTPRHHPASPSRAPQDRGLLSPQQRTQHHLPPSYEDHPPAAQPMSGNTPCGTRPPPCGQAQCMEPAQHREPPSHSSTHLAPPTMSPSHSAFSRSQTSLLSGISEKLSSSSKAASTSTSTPTPAPAKTKSRLNLRNPMSLLMRRRSGQALDPLADESLVTIRSPPASSSMPDNYDPSIRGNIVHDFNAPRLNRNYSYNNASAASDTQQDMGRVSPPKIDKEHTPVFHEHFDDDTSYDQSQAAIRAETLVNKDFLARNLVQFAPPARSPPLPPAAPKHLPPPQASSPPPRPTYQAFDSGFSTLSPVPESSNPIHGFVEVTPKKRQSTKSPPPARSRATSVTDPSFQPAGLPAHLSSRASRFSFQIPGGSDSAQEKLLEERHKAKEAEKAFNKVRNSTNSLADEYDEYNMDDYDMEGGFDEEIPMIGEEDEFEGLGSQTLDSGFNGFDFSLTQVGVQNSNVSPHLRQPLDMYANPIGFAMSEEALQQLKALAISPQPHEPAGSSTDVYGLGLSGHQEPLNGPSLPALPNASLDTTAGASQSHNSNQLDLDDDMYFDDGLIGHQEDPELADFDENVFDDPEGLLYERKVKFPDVDEASQALPSHPNAMMNSETGYEADDDTTSKHPEESELLLAHTTSLAQQCSLPIFNNMNAYHGALADAANRAEASGRFTRKASVDAGQPTPDIGDSSVVHTSQPSLIPDDGRYSLDTDVFPPEDDAFGMSSGYVDDYDYSDFESAMEDDPIIAAANAEALAYDDEGFYGQEFGFYASASGESSSTWGGFFGPSGLGRDPSGRNAVREPNLTPITERSEYSTRNSFISPNHLRDSSQQLSSPNLAQLARMSPYGWPDSSEDMSLDALMKLRKGAFGGSVASLPGSTSGSPRNASPMGMQFIPRSSSPVGNRMKEQNDEHRENDGSAKDMENLDGNDVDEEDKRLMNAVNAACEDEDDNKGTGNQERPESPTLAASDHNSLTSPTGYSVGNEAPLLPPISEIYAQHNMQLGTNTSLPKSPGGPNLTSAANVTLPMSPYGATPSSPYLARRRPSAPLKIDTSLSSPTAGAANSSGPRRQSLGFVSPISNSSPLTPSGSGWRAGHSRKCSAADSVTYVREHDEAGEGRWVLERRRTAESGELELIGREIVEGGRI